MGALGVMGLGGCDSCKRHILKVSGNFKQINTNQEETLVFSFADGSKSRRILPGWCIQIGLPACAVMLLPLPLGMLHVFPSPMMCSI